MMSQIYIYKFIVIGDYMKTWEDMNTNKYIVHFFTAVFIIVL